MVEICVAVADLDSAHGLMQGLARLFDRASVSFDSTRSEVRVRSEWESRAVMHVIDAVESWLAADDIGSAKLSIGDRSVTLFGPGRSAPPQRDLSEQAEGHAMKNACVATPASETDDQVRALATISALMRSAQGGNDSVTMLGRACESIGRALGFERTGIVRLSDDDRADAIAAHDWPLRELTEFAASAEVHAIFGLARQTGDVLLLTQALTLARGSRAVVVVPLIAAGRCHGFLLAARGDTAFDLDPTSRLLLATLGDI